MPKFTNRQTSPFAAKMQEKIKPDSPEIGVNSDVRWDEGDEVVTFECLLEKFSSIQFMVKEWVPYGMLTMILGNSGVGKSAFLMSLVQTVVTGGNWFGNPLMPSGPPGKVMWGDTEGANGINVHRIRSWGLAPLANQIVTPFDDLPIDLTKPDHLERIETLIVRFQIRLVIIDSLRGSHSGDENSSGVVKVLQALTAIAERTKAAIVLVHHTRKMGEGEEISADASRGSNGIVAMVRSQIGLDKPDPRSEWVRVQMLKENLGLKPKPFGFRVTDKGVEYGPTASAHFNLSLSGLAAGTGRPSRIFVACRPGCLCWGVA